MNPCLKNAFKPALAAALVVNLSACGTILYPERKGQKAGQIDVAVAALDAVGLLFFIIPGVIAFAVDFNNGAIYLPKGRKQAFGLNDLKKIRFDRARRPQDEIEADLRAATGKAIRLDDPRLLISRVDGVEKLPARFADR